MNITFLGAAKRVTGSCYLIEHDDCKFIVDCGMFQGGADADLLNQTEFPFNPSDIDFVLLTHAHIDHSGRLPLLVKNGFKNEIYSTKPTFQLCSVMLLDSAHIQEMESEWKSRKRLRAGKKPIEPMYNMIEATKTLEFFKPIDYDYEFNVTDNIRIKFVEAGHILGSSMIEINVKDKGRTKKYIFTGDIGKDNTQLLKDPHIFREADCLVMETTYGDRNHNTIDFDVDEFASIINTTLSRGGNVVIPSFAVERSQEIIYELNKQHAFKKNLKFKSLLNAPVYLDSPMAISATEIFRKNLELFDKETQEFIKKGDNPLDFPGLRFSKTAKESMAINEVKSGCVILSASGMCTAGRIKHHLKHNLWKENSTILFVGFQARGTLGRRILEGAKKVRIFNEEIAVKAEIRRIDGFSGHADQDMLTRWLSSFHKKPEKIFLVHGEEDAMKAFSVIAKKIATKSEIITPNLFETHSMDVDERYEEALDPSLKEYNELLETLSKLSNDTFDVTDMITDEIKSGNINLSSKSHILQQAKALNEKVVKLLDEIENN